MAEENFYLDNPDLRFHMEKLVDWPAILKVRESIGSADCPYSSPDEAIATYMENAQGPIGSLAAQRIAGPRAGSRRGRLPVQGWRGHFPEGLKAQLAGPPRRAAHGPDDPDPVRRVEFSRDHVHGGHRDHLRADASLMNFFGLQGGIAETINHFATDELKAKYPARHVVRRVHRRHGRSRSPTRAAIWPMSRRAPAGSRRCRTPRPASGPSAGPNVS